MIFVGYQGIGKSTLARKNNHYIDLESSCFYNNGKRPDDWYVYYAKIAEHLSVQGLDVFVSSHKEVRDELRNSIQPVYSIVPAPHLKYAWLKRLEDRYTRTRTEKDYRAWRNAEERYLENIKEIAEDYIPIVIESMDYDLEKLITEAKAGRVLEEIKREIGTIAVGEEWEEEE